MKASTAANTRPGWVSKSTFEALAIESGEESEDELVESTPLISPPDRYATYSVSTEIERELTDTFSSSESQPKPSKSAIKKAKEAARLERQQLKKAARVAARLQSNTKQESAVEPPIELQAAIELRPQPREEISNGAAHVSDVPDVPATKTNGSATSPMPVPNGQIDHVKEVQPAMTEQVVKPLPTPPPSLRHTSKSKLEEPRIVAEPPMADKKPEANGKVVHAPPPKPPAQDAEQTKKRQNVLTRTLWTFIMIGGFISTLLSQGAVIALTMSCAPRVHSPASCRSRLHDHPRANLPSAGIPGDHVLVPI